jgi:hypothetical protein
MIGRNRYGPACHILQSLNLRHRRSSTSAARRLRARVSDFLCILNGFALARPFC